MVMSNFLYIAKVTDNSFRKPSRSVSGTAGSHGSTKSVASCSSTRTALISRALIPDIARRNVCLFVSRIVRPSTVISRLSVRGFCDLLPGYHADVADDGLAAEAEVQCNARQTSLAT